LSEDEETLTASIAQTVKEYVCFEHIFMIIDSFM